MINNDLIKGTTFSTSEALIGTFMGSNLYRKCFFISGFPTFTSNTYKFSHGISGLAVPIRIFGVLYDTVNSSYYNLPFVTTANVNIMLYSSSSQITVEQSAYGNGRLKNFYIVIEYIKSS